MDQENSRPLATQIDHLVVDAGDRMGEAERAYRAFGFHLTERGFHTLGSVNHLAVFQGLYLELLGMGAGSRRADIATFPEGLNGFVFAAGDVDQLYRDLLARGVAAKEPVFFSRPVTLADGIRDAKFDVVRLEPEASPFGRFYFCHHQTPELVWTPEAQVHPNGVVAISRVRVSVIDPVRLLEFFGHTLGDTLRVETGENRSSFRVGDVVVDLYSAPDPSLSSIWAEAKGRSAYMATLTFRTQSLTQTARVLRENGVAGVIFGSESILIPATNAFNVGLEFVEA
ncbi:VOC family protein [Granulicella sp. WH15]|uniref:VOC family protein n=1 Tax=Granulicella sp. WH15 TaxID=2602070 RepID=UPI0013675ED2|nr:VOC family protein [Granulicella sp. WH15]QHN02601.1 VOC family protein [Granulicella sp. WH15]